VSIFTTSKEKKLWTYVLLVIAAILSTLFIGRPLADLLSDQGLQALLFIAGMILALVVIIVHAMKAKPGKMEVVLWLGILSVYMLTFLRLGMPERTHLMEYSVLAVFIHRALEERFRGKRRFYISIIYAFLLSVLVGILDECIQYFLPNRVFDPRDMVFNAVAISMALVAALLLGWIRNRKNVNKKES